MVVIGVAQFRPVLCRAEESREATSRILAVADRHGVDVLVLPELANSGYAFSGRDELATMAEAIPGGPYCELLREWSAAGRLVVAGVAERHGQGFYNSAVMFGSGKHLCTYRKAHLFDREKVLFRPGDEEPPVIEYDGVRYGVMICFDWAFPETARILALKGADVILHPANLVLPYCQDAMVTRSIENRVFTATANRVGTERGLTFTGMSQVTGPRGDVLLRLSKDEETVGAVEIDPLEARNKKVTERNDVLGDRRPELYRRLV